MKEEKYKCDKCKKPCNQTYQKFFGGDKMCRKCFFLNAKIKDNGMENKRK